jgi:molybdopterin-guanine dinucleotide biosynthesis protein B
MGPVSPVYIAGRSVRKRRSIQCRDASIEPIDGCLTAIGMRVFGFAGWSGSGKTTLIETLVPRLTARGLRVSLVKHAHHDFDVDQPGKDSHRHRMAGCTEVLVTSAVRFALIHELRGAPELSLSDALDRLSSCDLALVEGWKRATIPKLEIWRETLGKPALYPGDPWIRAVATDAPERVATPLPTFDLRNADAIATFIVENATGRLSPIDESRPPGYVEPV